MAVGRTIFAVAALVGSNAAYAADWVMVGGPAGKSPTRSIWFIDKSSVQNIGGFKRFWLEMVNETPDTKNIKHMKMFDEVDCGQRRERHLALQISDKSGTVLGSDDRLGDWSFVPPDSPISTLTTVVCSGDYSDTMSVGRSTVDIWARATFDVLDDRGRLRKPPHR